MPLAIDLSRQESYSTFLQIKKLPRYHIAGRTAWIPDEYAHLMQPGFQVDVPIDYSPLPDLFDYQRDISRLAIRKRKFSVFADCGLGKTMIMLEYARHVAQRLGRGRRVLIVCPLMVAPQTVLEAQRWYGESLKVQPVPASLLDQWINSTSLDDCTIGITNYESLLKISERSLASNTLGCLILDESSMLKSTYGKFGQICIQLGRGLDWKLCLTGTPAPNDRIEYGNHAIFLDQFRSLNEFLARYFVNKGKTSARWILKPHALRPFYRDLSAWCIFLTNPAVYGWQDNCRSLPPIHTHIEHVEMTPQQADAARRITGGLVMKKAGGIGQRAKLSRLGKGWLGDERIPTNKPGRIRELLNSWQGEESAILWCRYNEEQVDLSAMLSAAANIDGKTKLHTRQRLISEFKLGDRTELISKPKILGFGLNLQVATRQIFSTLQDSYEEYWQAIKRSNRYGSTRPLHVHIPVTEIEMPMVETVLAKADRIQADTEEQESLFRECGIEL